ncbi:MAG: B12-binding domain-containing radical SAM protein [Nanoarchaeota archaeon]|nr:B12-binding domain-containing radical SAM protein [Nanoarchaeota archaeon]
MKQFKTLLIQANSTLDTLIPPNLAIMSAFLKQAGIQVKLFDTTFYKTREKTGDDARVNTLQVKETNFEDLGIKLYETDMYADFMKLVKEYNPNLIGLSAVSLTYPLGINFLKRLREEGNLTPTIVGGIHSTIAPKSVLEEKCVDYICRGEGERSLVELCTALRDNKDTTNIKNIWAKKDEKIFQNPMREPIDINTLPFQDWGIFDKRRIYKPMGGEIRRVGSFELDRGCPYSCSYCSNNFWNKMYKGKNYRQKDVKKFIEEVKHMKEKYDLEYVYLASETFLASKEERFKEFVSLWGEEIKLPFWCQTRPETVTEERIKMLKDLGMHSLGIGLESGSPEVRKILNRKMTNKQIEYAFETCKKLNVRVGVNNIVGIPGETREQIFETIELNRKIGAKNIMTHIFNAYQGTPLYEECVQKGYLSGKQLGGDYRQDYSLNQPNMKKEEVLGLQRTFALYVKMPKKRWPEIKRAEKFDNNGNATFQKLKKEYTKDFLN